LYDKAKEYERQSIVNGEEFFWNSYESLEDLERPERMEEIKRGYESRREQRRNKRRNLPLMQVFDTADDTPDMDEGCLICQL